VSIALLDVNVLIALLDAEHVHHEHAHQWFARNQKHGWATCPITLNGCIRIVSSPAYPILRAAAAEAISSLGTRCTDPHHEFWPDSVSILDESLFRRSFISGHRAIADIYLLGLAVHRHGKLATFDGAIPSRAVVGASSRHLEIIV
jgi:hypothetical protein